MFSFVICSVYFLTALSTLFNPVDLQYRGDYESTTDMNYIDDYESKSLRIVEPQSNYSGPFCNGVAPQRDYLRNVGKHQSPISVPPEHKQVRVDRIEMTFFNIEVPVRGPSLLNDRGYRAIVSPRDGVQRYMILNDVSGTTIVKPERYNLQEFHFHWGPGPFSGTSHAINGTRMAFETHVTFIKDAYGNLTNALNFKDGLVILAILHQQTPYDNPVLTPVVELAKRIRFENDTAQSDPSEQIFMDRLLPENKEFTWMRRGSTTFPPCWESVTWIVFKHPSTIGENQFPFRNWLVQSDGRMVLNRDANRLIQPLAGRTVYNAAEYGIYSRVTNGVYPYNYPNYPGSGGGGAGGGGGGGGNAGGNAGGGGGGSGGGGDGGDGGNRGSFGFGYADNNGVIGGRDNGEGHGGNGRTRFGLGAEGGDGGISGGGGGSGGYGPGGIGGGGGGGSFGGGGNGLSGFNGGGVGYGWGGGPGLRPSTGGYGGGYNGFPRGRSVSRSYYGPPNSPHLNREWVVNHLGSLRNNLYVINK